MTANHGLSDVTVKTIREVLAAFPAVNEAILFGSRAKQMYKRGSDIDLALVGPNLDWRIIGRIDDMLDDLLLPYRFSLIVWNHETDPEVAAHIRRVGIPLFQRTNAVSEK